MVCDREGLYSSMTQKSPRRRWYLWEHCDSMTVFRRSKDDTTPNLLPWYQAAMSWAWVTSLIITQKGSLRSSSLFKTLTRYWTSLQIFKRWTAWWKKLEDHRRVFLGCRKGDKAASRAYYPAVSFHPASSSYFLTWNTVPSAFPATKLTGIPYSVL